ncbi:MAG: hypothetical protein WBG08_14465 [Litorimonas sp.]
MTDTPPERDETDEEPESAPPGFMRRTVAPAVAIVLLYASVRVLPPVLLSQPPPFDFGHLIEVFVIALAVFSLISLYQDYRGRQRKGDE